VSASIPAAPHAETGIPASELAQQVTRIVQETPVLDMHTHLFAPAFGECLLYGIDELMTYHYLIAEVLRAAPIDAEAFYALTKREQANLIWRELFVERSPLSEACRGVLTVLHALGLDPAVTHLDAHREALGTLEADAHVDNVFRLANMSGACMTNDPFDPVEREAWDKGYLGDKRFHAALRIDPLLNDWPNACARLQAEGFDVEPTLNERTLQEVRRFLSQWLERMDAWYMAVSLPPDFVVPEDSPRARILESCIMPAARDANVPFAMMIGVTRAVNPAYRLAGDGAGKASLEPLQYLCARFPENKFLVTMLSRENQHELCVTARKFGNLHIFGCWWFLNNPSLIEEMTRMRLELLGLSVTPQHSDARILEQVVYKWRHSRAIIAKVLADKYADIAATGWPVTEKAIQRDAAMLLGGNFRQFCGRGPAAGV